MHRKLLPKKEEKILCKKLNKLKNLRKYMVKIKNKLEH